MSKIKKNKNTDSGIITTTLIKKEVDELLHVYDFLSKCRITRNEHEIFLKKFESNGLKTIDEWVNITNLTPIGYDFKKS